MDAGSTVKITARTNTLQQQIYVTSQNAWVTRIHNFSRCAHCTQTTISPLTPVGIVTIQHMLRSRPAQVMELTSVGRGRVGSRSQYQLPAQEHGANAGREQGRRLWW